MTKSCIVLWIDFLCGKYKNSYTLLTKEERDKIENEVWWSLCFDFSRNFVRGKTNFLS